MASLPRTALRTLLAIVCLAYLAVLGCTAPGATATLAGATASAPGVADEGPVAHRLERATAKVATLTSIAVKPASPKLYVGTTEALTATGTFSSGPKENITGSCTWTSSNMAIATVSPAGEVTAVARGTATITATDGTVLGTATVTVLGTLLSIAVTPSATTFPAGSTEALKATGTYDNAATKNLTRPATWASSNTSVVTVSTTGVVTAVGVGTATVSASTSASAPGLVTGSATFTVTAATLTSIAVTPATKKIPTGASQQFVATGTFSDGSTHVLGGASLSWSSSATSFATVSATGLVTGVAVGQSTITATGSGASATALANVTGVALKSIAISPTNPSTFVGDGLFLSATGTYTDGTTMDLTSEVTWASSNTTVAVINSGPIVEALAAGTTTLTATLGKKVGTTALTVAVPVLQSISITPGSTGLTVGMAASFTATGNYSDGSSPDITSTVNWSTSVANVVSFALGACGTLVVTGVGAGTTNLTATDPTSGLSASATLSVSAERAGTSVLSLRLFDPNDNPLTPSSAPGLSLNLQAVLTPDGGTTFSASPTPDCTGTYDVLVPTGELSIVAQSLGAPVSGMALPTGFQINGTLDIAGDGAVSMVVPTVTLTVDVTDPSDNAIAGASIQASDFTEGALVCGSAFASCKGGFLTNADINGNEPALTGPSGQSQLYGFAIPDVSISVGAPTGFVNGGVTFDASQSTTAYVTLQPAVETVPLSFQLTDTNGTVLTPKNAPGLQVFIGSIGNNLTPDGLGNYTANVTLGQVLIAALGSFAGSGLALPDSIEFGGYLAIAGPLTTTIAIPATTLTVDVTDPNGDAVAGATSTLESGLTQLASCGSLLTGCQAQFSSSHDIYGNDPATTNAGGTSLFYGFPESGVTVAATPPSGSDLGPATVTDDASASNVLGVQLLGPQSVSLTFSFIDANMNLVTPTNEPSLQVFVGNLSNVLTSSTGVYTTGVVPGSVFIGLDGPTVPGLALPVPSAGFAGYLSVTGAMTIQIAIPAAGYTFNITDPNNDVLANAQVVWSAGPGPVSLGNCGTQLANCETLFTSNTNTAGVSPALTDDNGNVTLYGFGAASTSVTVTPPAGSGFLTETFSPVDASGVPPIDLELAP
jgi:trimeric autotransporter adhesin